MGKNQNWISKEFNQNSGKQSYSWGQNQLLPPNRFQNSEGILLNTLQKSKGGL